VTSRLLRTLLVGASFVLWVALPSTASASTLPASIPQCIQAVHQSHSSGLTLAEAQACAPSGVVLSSRRVPTNQAGTFIGKTEHGYVILVNSVGKASGDPCSFDASHLYDVGITDWMGAYFCWNYQGNPWVCCNVQMSCNAWTPGAGCDYRYYNFPLGQYGQVGYVQLEGHFYQTCTFGFGCDDGLMEEIDTYGNYTVWSWSF